MQPEQQRILGYFIEEAGDHLQTIEHGLLNLQTTIDDPEMVNEVFRAAHSVKGGAAMLGLNSIQQSAHRLEDSFKLLKEKPIRVDRDLESLFLRIFDALQEQLDQLQSPTGLTEASAAQIMSGMEPTFSQLNQHLRMLMQQSTPARTPASSPPPEPERPMTPMPSISSDLTTDWYDDEDASAMQLIFQSDVLGRLREMLKLFQQSETPAHREQLVALCRLLSGAGDQFEIAPWTQLLNAAQQAIANPNNTFSTLASILIKEIKQAQELVLSNRGNEIAISPKLQELLPAAALEPPDELDFDDLFSLNSEDSAASDFTTEDLDLFGSEQTPAPADIPAKSNAFRGPEVGMAELNTLADLFEGETPELEAWNEAADLLDSFNLNGEGEGGDLDLSEFMFDEDPAMPESARPAPPSDDDDLTSLFGYDFDGAIEEAPVEAAPSDSPARNAGAQSPHPQTPQAPEQLDELFTGVADDLFDDLSSFSDPPVASESTATADSDWDNLWDEMESEGADVPLADTAEIADTDLSDLLAMSAPEPPSEDENDSMFLDGLLRSAETDRDESTELWDGTLNFNPPPSSSPADIQTDDVSIDDLFADEPLSGRPESAIDRVAAITGSDDLFGSAFDADFEAPAHSEPSETDVSLEFLNTFSDNLGASETDDISAEGQSFDDLWNQIDAPEASADSATQTWDDDLTQLFGSEPPAADRPHTPVAEPPVPTAPRHEPPPANAIADSDTDLAPELIPLDLLLQLEPQFVGEGVFDALEAFLTTPAAPPARTKSAKPDPTPAQSNIALSDNDFDDLAKLLEETEKTMGPPPSSTPRATPAETRSSRSSRRKTGGFEQNMRVPIKQLDNLSNLVGELVVSRNSLEQDQERLRQFLDTLLHQVQRLSDVGQRMQDLYERTLLEMALLASRKNRMRAAQGGGSSQGDSHDFEALEMDRFTDFHTQAQEIIEMIVRVRESASDIEFLVQESDQVTRQLRQTTTQLQEGLTRSRMVPFSQLVDRLPRGVRDNAIKLGKQVELQVEGRDTLIDKMILEQLTDPMTHLVNNAVAHGVENPSDRTANGKTPTGRITVSAFHQGNQTIISVNDDGGGIDAQRVKQKALQKRLITAEQAQNMSNLDIYDLLFLPGFSTKDQADDLSGRGVGMDVVKTKLTEIRGTINTDSNLGKGTSFTIRLPLTLSISKALCCVNEQGSIAFPMDGVADVLDTFPPSRLVQDAKGFTCVPWRDQQVPFYPLRELFSYNRALGKSRYSSGPATDDESISVIILRSTGTYIAIQVNQIVGEQEIVIKQLEGPVPKPMGIAGATIMGDGRIVPIADVLELIDLSLGRVRRETGSSIWHDGAAAVEMLPEKIEPTVLIIDDSITVRELLSMTFKKAGYRVEQARDGQEAWDKLRGGIPCDLVFCDMEMPRMNGMELLSRLHKDSHLHQLPIAMLTSRTAEKHKQMAIELGARGYFTKPYLEEVLLDAAQRMLKGEILVTAKAESKSESKAE
jgi:chemotaxis protein histidine kinase CheA/FixJ family two-component response regulator